MVVPGGGPGGIGRIGGGPSERERDMKLKDDEWEQCVCNNILNYPIIKLYQLHYHTFHIPA